MEYLLMNKRAILFINGSIPDLQQVRRFIHPEDLLLAVDGGTRHLRSMGLAPSAIIGDLDSLTMEDRNWAATAGSRLIEYPRDKNETDLELALTYALAQGSTEILLVGALGGRLDQALGNLALLTDHRFSGLEARLDDGLEEAWFVRRNSAIHGQPGDIVSLLPWGEPVTGVSTEGLRWPLHSETLYPEKTRGISNEMLDRSAHVAIQSGLLLIVHRREHQS